LEAARGAPASELGGALDGQPRELLLRRVGAQHEAKDYRGDLRWNARRPCGGLSGVGDEGGAEFHSVGAHGVRALCRARGAGMRLDFIDHEAWRRSKHDWWTCMRRGGGYDGMDGSVAANGGLRVAYGGDAVGWAARVGSFGSWACGAWRWGIRHGRRCGGCRSGGRSGASTSGPSQGRGLAPAGARRRAGACSDAKSFQGVPVRLLFSPKS
jgi:hypothetical protein